jgi:pimeloyl-ACP methyl ester carboxylesterase
MYSEKLQVGGCDIAVDCFGKGPALVVLHGEDGPRNAGPCLEKLSETFEVHVPRLPGWHDTTRAPHVRTARDVALVAQEYVERLDKPVALMGLSFGGWLAAEIAATVPRLVAHLVLVSPIGIKVGGREDRDFADLYILTAAERTALYYAPGKAPTINTNTNADVFLEKAMGDEAIARYCWQPYMHDPGLSARLRRIAASTLILSGDHDGFVLNPTYYTKFAALIPGARHDVVAGAGHRIEEEEPANVAKRVVAFVAAATSQPRAKKG